MRFAYIDSGGNEVPIPSVDALALRIELGAVGPDTQLYDAQADHWGPAHTHEIFHTLSREKGQDGFVPPPPAAPSVPPPAVAAPKKPASPPPAKQAKRPPAGKPKESKPASPAAADLGLTLADPPPERAVQPPAASGGDDALDFTLDVAAPPSAAKPKHVPTPPGEPPASFDFGGLDGTLEIERSSLDTDPPASSGGFGGDLPLETPLQFTGGMSAGGGGDDHQLEVAGSSFAPGSPPGWAAESGGGGVMDFSSAAAEAEEEALIPPAPAPAQQRRPLKDKPSPPKFRKQRSSGPLVLLLLALALGAGGYFGWPILSARLARPEPTPEPAFTLPSIPPELVPRMRALAEGALADVVAEVERGTASGAPTEPDPEWLRGNYLANASQFASIETFWTSVGEFVQGVRDADDERYRERLAERVAADRIPADTAAILVARAEAGLVAAAAARAEAYATMERLVDAALSLHDFLVANDASIEYRPANVSTLDPILEAVPASPAIGDEMSDRIEGYTDALDLALGSIDRVTRARLTTALSTRVQQIGVE